MRNNLNCGSQIVATALGGQHSLVYRSGGRVGITTEVLVDETFVVPEVQIGLATVVGDKHLAVLIWVHRPGVNVDVRVQLLHRDAKTTALEKSTERGSRKTLA